MSIKPIDFQVMLPKTAEVSKINNDNLNKSQTAQQQQTALNQHKADNNVNTVHAQDNSQKAKIQDKQKKQRIVCKKKRIGKA